MPSVTSAGGVNSSGALPSAQLQADFYAKLSRLENDLLTGKHPRFKLSPAALNQIAWALNQGVSPAASAALESGDAVANDFTSLNAPAESSQQSSQIVTLSAGRSAPTNGAITPFQSASSPRQVGSTRPVSWAFDPVLLSKSDELVSAEIALKRQRIERALKLAVERKKNNSLDKDSVILEGPNNLDLIQVQAAAAAIVKPVSGISSVIANGDSASVSSFDNGYYSSQVDSWSLEENGSLPTPNTSISQDQNMKNKTNLNDAQNGKNNVQLGKEGSRGGLEGESRAVGRGDKLPSRTVPPADGTGPSGNGLPVSLSVNGHRNESYSPPSANVSASFQDGIIIKEKDSVPLVPRDHQRGNQLAQPKPYPSNYARDSESYSPPPPDMRVATNQIDAPFAPQSAHGLHLAVNHLPHATPNVSRAPINPSNDNHGFAKKGVRRNTKRKGLSGGDFATTAIAAPTSQRQPNAQPQIHRQFQDQGQHLNHARQLNRKRKRLDEQPNIARRHSDQDTLQPITSPLPYLKQEPLSPPPFASGDSRVEPPRRVVLREDGRAHIETVISRSRPNLQVRTRDDLDLTDLSDHEPFRGEQEPDGQAFNDSPIIVSPVIRRRVHRDDMDLRRAASIRYANRPYSPSQYYLDTDGEVRYPPTTSRVADRPISRPMHYVADGKIRLSGREPRTRQSFALETEADDFLPAEIETWKGVPPPAKRRIIIDEHGHEYIAVPAATYSRQSLVREIPYAEPLSPYGTSVYRQQSHATARPHPVYPRPQVIEIEDNDGNEVSSRLQIHSVTQEQPRRRSDFVNGGNQLNRRRIEIPERTMQKPIYVDRDTSRATTLQPLSDFEKGRPSRFAAPPAYIVGDDFPIQGEHAYSARPNAYPSVWSRHGGVEYGVNGNMYR